jgi:hypothetical protein
MEEDNLLHPMTSTKLSARVIYQLNYLGLGEGRLLKTTVSGMMLTLLLVGMLTLAFSIQQARAEDNLLLEISVSKTIVIVGEDINVALTLKNVGETNVTIAYSPPLFDVYYSTPEGCFRWSDGKVFVLIELFLTLEPGEAYNQTLQWNLYQYKSGVFYPPKPGTYNLFGLCYPAGITTPYSIAVMLILPPVGGYTFPIKGYSVAEPLTTYLALVAILTVAFTAIKHKTKRVK